MTRAVTILVLQERRKTTKGDYLEMIPPELLLIPATVFVILFYFKKMPKIEQLPIPAILIVILFILVFGCNYGELGRLLFACGLWVFCDGLISILMYLGQTLPEHIPRVLRLVIGAILVVVSWKM